VERKEEHIRMTKKKRNRKVFTLHEESKEFLASSDTVNLDQNEVGGKKEESKMHTKKRGGVDGP